MPNPVSFSAQSYRVTPLKARPRFGGQIPGAETEASKTLLTRQNLGQYADFTGITQAHIDAIPANAMFQFGNDEIDRGTSLGTMIVDVLKPLASLPTTGLGVIIFNNTRGKVNVAGSAEPTDGRLYAGGKPLTLPTKGDVSSVLAQAEALVMKNPAIVGAPNCRLTMVKIQKPTPMGILFIKRHVTAAEN